jgi:phosphate transport system substrate-binding protein
MSHARSITQTILALLLVAALVLAGCGGDDNDAPSSSKTTITISGAFALYPMVVKWTEEYNKLHPDVQFDVSAGGAGKGMSDVLAGAADVAMVSREVRKEESDQGALPFAVAKDAVVAVVNADNPALEALLAVGLTPEKGAAIWFADTPGTWGDLVDDDTADEIHVYTRSDAAGAAEMWALFLGGTAQEDLKGIAVNGDPGLAEAVRQDALGIGYNNIGFAYDPSTGAPVEGLRVVPLDLDGDGQISPDEDFYASKDDITAAIAGGRYPAPPARPLYLVTKGDPNEAVSAFLRWVLTDGQAFVTETGYVQVTEDLLQVGLDGLGEE